jgi:hypothetical protein
MPPPPKKTSSSPAAAPSRERLEPWLSAAAFSKTYGAEEGGCVKLKCAVQCSHQAECKGHQMMAGSCGRCRRGVTHLRVGLKCEDESDNVNKGQDNRNENRQRPGTVRGGGDMAPGLALVE